MKPIIFNFIIDRKGRAFWLGLDEPSRWGIYLRFWWPVYTVLWFGSHTITLGRTNEVKRRWMFCLGTPSLIKP